MVESIFIDDIVDGKHVILLYEGEDRPVHLFVNLVSYGIVRLDDLFGNPSKARAFLVSELGYGPSCDLLEKHDVPLTSRLWDLNHSGPPARLRNA